MTAPAVTLREIALSDASVAAELSAELGYPVSPRAMAARIQQLQRLPHHIVYVASLAEMMPETVPGLVVAWIHLSIAQHLQSEPYCEIGGLIVASSLRGSGIGALLVAKAEQWARQQGVSSMLVRSRISREAAHRFYLREGYTQTKTSAVFSKQLTPHATG